MRLYSRSHQPGKASSMDNGFLFPSPPQRPASAPLAPPQLRSAKVQTPKATINVSWQGKPNAFRYSLEDFRLQPQAAHRYKSVKDSSLPSAPSHVQLLQATNSCSEEVLALLVWRQSSGRPPCLVSARAGELLRLFSKRACRCYVGVLWRRFAG